MKGRREETEKESPFLGRVLPCALQRGGGANEHPEAGPSLSYTSGLLASNGGSIAGGPGHCYSAQEAGCCGLRGRIWKPTGPRATSKAAWQPPRRLLSLVVGAQSGGGRQGCAVDPRLTGCSGCLSGDREPTDVRVLEGGDLPAAWPGLDQGASCCRSEAAPFASSWCPGAGAARGVTSRLYPVPAGQVPRLPPVPLSSFVSLSRGEDHSKNALADIYGILTIPDALGH